MGPQLLFGAFYEFLIFFQFVFFKVTLGLKKKREGLQLKLLLLRMEQLQHLGFSCFLQQLQEHLCWKQ